MPCCLSAFPANIKPWKALSRNSKKGGRTMQSKQIAIDIEKTIGKPPYWLAEVSEDWEYKDNKRTANQRGFRYAVAIPQLAFEKIGVKIPGRKLIDLPEGEICEVDFKGLSLSVYVQSNGRLALTGRADSISLAPSNEKKG